jgi:hypothetical protein
MGLLLIPRLTRASPLWHRLRMHDMAASARTADTGPEAQAPRRAQLAVASALIVAIWLAAVVRWIATDTVVPWDSKNQFYAFFRFLAASIHSGAAPFWNPYHYGGHPSVADPQSLIFAPAFVLAALFDPAPSLRAFDLIVFAHLLIGALAMGAIGWRARWPIAACVLAAAVFMLGGAAAGRLQHTGMILSYAMFPPALLLLQLALARRSLALALAFAAVAAMLALGRNQIALLLCFVLLAVAAAEMGSWRDLRERLAVLLAMGVAGLALIAVPMLLTLQFAVLSNRPAEALDAALRGSLHPANLATLMVANVFGSHAAYWGPGGSLPEVAYTDDSFNYMFVGFVPVALVLWIGVAGGAAWRRGRILMTAVLLVALLFMLGRYTPFFPLAFEYVPGIALFRRPVDANFMLGAALAILTGHMLADYVQAGLPPLRVVRCAITALAALAVLTLAVMFSARSGHGRDALWRVLAVAPIALLVIVVLARARDAPARLRAAALVTAIAVAELLGWNAAFRLNAEPRAFYAVLEAPAGADTEAIAVLEAALRADHAGGERPRVEVAAMGGPWQNLAMVRGWEAINGYNPLRIGVYDRLVAPGESNWLAALREFPASFDGYDGALARALGLTYVVLGVPIEEMPGLARPPEADVLMAGPRAWIYRLRHKLPRIAFPGGTARISAWRGDRIEIETESETGGVLALHVSHYPGWVAEIDGMAAPIRRAETLFQAVEAPAGRHRVVFRFAPFSPQNLAQALADVLRRTPARPD